MADKKSTKTKSKPMTKAALLQQVAADTGLSRKQVDEAFDALTTLVNKELSKKGPGTFTIPGLLRLNVVRKKATKERKGPNPFKPDETVVFKAKPARNRVKARALKSLNDLLK